MTLRTSRPAARPRKLAAALLLGAAACARREVPLAVPAPPAAPAGPFVACGDDGRPVPALLEAAWRPMGPQGGPVLSLAAEPGTSTAYAGARSLWKTTDGRSWARASVGLVREVRAIAVHPRALGTVYAAAYDGLYVSTDRAATWTRLPGLVPPQDDPAVRSVPYSSLGITAIAVAPWVTRRSPEETLLAGTDAGGLWRSTDGGATWERADLAPATTVDAISFDPAHPDVVFAAGVHSSGSRWMGAVYRSEDGGTRWSPTSLRDQQELREVFVDPAFRDVVYAGGHGLFESRDGGATWERVLMDSIFAFAAYDEGQEHVRLAAGLQGVHRKAGRTGGWTADPAGAGLPHEPWARAAAVVAGGTVLAGTRTGILASGTGGRSWTPASGGIFELDVEELGAGPAASGIVYAAATSGGVFRSLDGGATWTKGAHPDEQQHVTAIAVEWRRPERAWMTGGGGLFRTVDAGATWAAIPGVPRAEAVALDPSDESVVYVATESRGVFRSTDGFRTWTALDLGGVPPIQLAVSPGTPGVLWVGSYSGFCRMDLLVPSPRCGPLIEAGGTYAIAVDPASGGDTVHLSTLDGLHVTTDRGGRWTRLERRPPYSSLAWAGGALFASSMIHGVEVSCDGGATFEPVGVGGPKRVPRLAVVADQGLAVFGSSLDGVYRVEVR